MKVSIIIPAYNAERFLARAIEAALAQDHPDTEIILVDNNSTDGTAAIINEYLKKHPDKLSAINANNQGCSQARNAGFAIATGTWIAFLDADDFIQADKISHQLSQINADTRWVISAYRHYHTDGSTEDSIPHQDPWHGLVYNFEIGYTSSNLIHRNALLNINGWNELLPDNTDPDLHFRLLKNGTQYVIDPVIKTHYHHHNSDRVTTRRPIGRLARKADFHRAVNEYLITERPGYWRSNAAFFNSCELAALRMLATHDLPAASERYSDAFPGGVEKLDPKVLTKIPLLYPYLGFSGTERLRKLISTLVPKAIVRRGKKFLC